MEIIKLIYNNKIGANNNNYVEIEINKKNDDEFELTYFKYGNKKLNTSINGEETKILKNELYALQNSVLLKKHEVSSSVKTEHIWKLIIDFSDGKQIQIEDRKDCSDLERTSLLLYFWVKERCENFSSTESTIINNPTDIDIWEIDKKFELLDQETIKKMAGTGSELTDIN